DLPSHIQGHLHTETRIITTSGVDADRCSRYHRLFSRITTHLRVLRIEGKGRPAAGGRLCLLGHRLRNPLLGCPQIVGVGQRQFDRLLKRNAILPGPDPSRQGQHQEQDKDKIKTTFFPVAKHNNKPPYYPPNPDRRRSMLLYLTAAQPVDETIVHKVGLRRQLVVAVNQNAPSDKSRKQPGQSRLRPFRLQIRAEITFTVTPPDQLAV